MSDTDSTPGSEDRRSSIDSIFEREPQRCTMMNCDELLKPARFYTKVEVRPKVWIRTHTWKSNCPKHGPLDEETGKMACPSGATSDANIRAVTVPRHARNRSIPSIIARASQFFPPASTPPPSVPLPSLPTMTPTGAPLAAPAGPATPYPHGVAIPTLPFVPPLPYAASTFGVMPSYAAASVVHPFAMPVALPPASVVASMSTPRAAPPPPPPAKSLPSPPRPPRPADSDGHPFAVTRVQPQAV